MIPAPLPYPAIPPPLVVPMPRDLKVRLPLMSPSQVDTFALCERKWGWRYLDGINEPPHRSAAAGTRVHEVLEAWLRHGTPPNDDEVLVIDGHEYRPGLIARSGLHHLPPPGPHLDLEADFEVPFVTGYPALWRGRMDAAYRRLEDRVHRLPDGTEVVVESVEVPEGLDHKTTSNLVYRKLPEELALDAQGLVYSYALLRNTGAPRVNLRWVYYKSSKPYKSEPSFTTLTKEHVYANLPHWEILAQKAIRAKLEKRRALDMPVNPRACDKYGGCPHKTRCNLTGREIMRATMGQELDFLAKVAQAQAALEAGGTAAPPPPIATQPVFAPVPPAAYAPPAQHPASTLAQPPGYPMWTSSPQMTAAQAQAYTHPAQSQVAAPAPMPAVQAPAPMPQPQAFAPSLPAPWQVHSDDARWLVNPATGEFEQNTPEGVGRVFARYAPPPQPPAPPAMQPPPAALPPQPAPPAQAVQAVQAPALEPSMRAALLGAIRGGATDEQIRVVYPHVVPHLAELRASVNGVTHVVPAIATGINAPEGAKLPHLAEPPPPAPVQATPETPEPDTSKIGDEFDAMDKDQLRGLAKANNIDVKGLKEKNLRNTVRSVMRSKALAPQPPPAAQPTLPAAQPTLPWTQPVQPSPSIPQVVQAHLAAPMPVTPSAPPPVPLAATGSPNLAVEIRAALDDLNAIHRAYVALQERLHRLLGIG